MIVTIQTVTDKDMLQEAFHVRREVFVEEQEVAEDLEWDEFDDAPETVHVLARDENERPVGAARFRPYPQSPDTCKVERVAVLMEQRTGGVGRQVMNFVEQEAARRGFGETYLHAQIQALGFYEKLGYRAEGSRFWEAGIEHVAMRKKLA